MTTKVDYMLCDLYQEIYRMGNRGSQRKKIEEERSSICFTRFRLRERHLQKRRKP